MSAIRPEAAGDVTAIHLVHVEAFGRRDEADLLDALRLAGAPRVALVAVEDGAVVGHVVQPGGESGRCERHQCPGFGANGNAAGGLVRVLCVRV